MTVAELLLLLMEMWWLLMVVGVPDIILASVV